MQEPENLRKAFTDRYGTHGTEPVLFFAPGRVNLIGEHTDYNGGFVLPCAILYGTYLLIRKTDDKLIKLASVNDPQKTVIPVTDHFSKQSVHWFNYPLGVFEQFVEKGIPVGGMEFLFYGDIPVNAGLSSSASIEMVTAFAVNHILNGGLDLLDLVKMSQRAEHEFAGVNCGIMDQFAVGMGKANHAIFLNCNNLVYKLVAVPLSGYKLIIANTNKPRSLADSKYNERVAECQLAVAFLAERFSINKLGDLGYPQFFKAQDCIPDEVIRKRARHVISENQRVLASVSSLLRDDLAQFGVLMNASHDSLRNNYEVTGFELDTFVEEARKITGVLGSRMTGAGFGGCTVSLVREDVIADFIEKVGREYKAKTGLTPDFYVAEIGDGVRMVERL
ncbi:MAG: galactokinase [Bacteroidetes bacterium]|nr:MAG: galactokinase [Bacteroidota bacterium]